MLVGRISFPVMKTQILSKEKMIIRLTDKVSGKKIGVSVQHIVKTHAMDDGMGTLLTHSEKWCTSVLEKEAKVIRLVNNALNGIQNAVEEVSE